MKTYKSEKFSYIDKNTGAEVTRFTSWRTNSNHLYFTNNCFYDNGKKLVFASERDNAPNLYSLDIASGEISQLTDLPVPSYPNNNFLQLTYVDAIYKRAVFFSERKLFALDIESKQVKEIYSVPAGYFNHIASIGADGKYAYTSVYEDVRDRRRGTTLQDTFDAHPHSMIMKIAIDGSGSECVHEENNFIAHVNASPTDPDKLTFCHEGFWEQVDHRLWALDLKTHELRRLHECREREAIGHEYWFADGERIGYHGIVDSNRVGPTDEQLLGISQLGAVNFDGTRDKAYEFPYNMGHIFSQDEKLIIGDGGREGKYLRLWQLTENGYSEPRALCMHNCTFKMQQSHVHPRTTPDGKSVLYTSDESGYNQLYIVKIPEKIESLPLLKDIWSC